MNMSSGVSTAFDYLDRGDLKDAVASLVSNMNARPIANCHTTWQRLRFAPKGERCAGLRTLIEGAR